MTRRFSRRRTEHQDPANPSRQERKHLPQRQRNPLPHRIRIRTAEQPVGRLGLRSRSTIWHQWRLLGSQPKSFLQAGDDVGGVEPQNLPGYNPWYWDGTKWVEKAQPENYARFLRRTNQALQAAQNERGAGAEVLFAGLYSPGGMSVTEFLNKAHNVSEAFNSFSALSLHPYAFNGTTVEGNVSAARTALKNIGWNSKPIWVTEVGWPIEGEHAVYPIQQAEYLHNSFTWLVQNSASLNIPYVAWYDYRDINGAPWDFHSGLKDVNGNKRPSSSDLRGHDPGQLLQPVPALMGKRQPRRLHLWRSDRLRP